MFEALLEKFPNDGPSRFYLARCQSYASGHPAPDDPHVIRMDAK